jgi:hypothetical protein
MDNTKTMLARLLFAWIGGALLAFSIPPGTASAAVLLCGNCTTTDYKSVASNAGEGMHIVVDFPQSIITGWEVEYDMERRVWTTRRRTVPESIQNSFAYDMSPAMASSGATIIVGPNEGNGISLPAGFENVDAYDIARDASLRHQLELKMANIYNGATTESPIWNNLATSLKSLVLSYLGQQIGVSSVTIVIVWGNGSRTELKLEAGRTHEAVYQAGKSRGADGNKIPDAAAVDSNTGSAYAGDYYFSDVNELINWVETARLFGIPITGSGDGTRGGMSCTWVESTLTCTYIIY